MPSPTRADIENAARMFFASLQDAVDVPRALDREDLGRDVAYQVHQSEERIRELDRDLITNQFDNATRQLAQQMLAEADVKWDALDQRLRLEALRSVTRATREQMAYAIHQITRPATPYRPTDDLFIGPAPVITAYGSSIALSSGEPARQEPLAAVSQQYLNRKRLSGLGGSHLQELGRALGWLEQALGGDTPISTVRKEQLREFRDDLTRLDVRLRGRTGDFKDRLTNVADRQIKSATSSRYWKSIQGFFAWCEEEGFVPTSPAGGLKVHKRKGETRESPPPFSGPEISQLLATPLYAGRLSARSPKRPGTYHSRDGRWWSMILILMSGLRAGELSQLFPTDFVFDAEVPHLKVSEEDETGAKVKSAKTLSSIRAVPLHPVLLQLGLREFVDWRNATYPKERLFREFRLGADGRKSDGMTKFWTDYLKTFGLWKPGRSTHVGRHTFVAGLRASGVSDDDIGAIVGHAGRTITSQYGGEYPLMRKATALAKLDYGADLVGRLGGPFDPKKHKA